METLGKDIRYGLRMLLKAPSVSIVATIALALGIGANTAIFSVINAVLLRPLPFSNSEQLMAVWESDQTRGVSRGSYSYPNFMDLREQNHSFDQVASYHQSDFIMTGRGEPARMNDSDRKSTRLNSSHMSISYAVFCLKKKKKKKNKIKR